MTLTLSILPGVAELADSLNLIQRIELQMYHTLGRATNEKEVRNSLTHSPES